MKQTPELKMRKAIETFKTKVADLLIEAQDKATAGHIHKSDYERTSDLANNIIVALNELN